MKPALTYIAYAAVILGFWIVVGAAISDFARITISVATH